jgi:hypothetical protein
MLLFSSHEIAIKVFQLLLAQPVVMNQSPLNQISYKIQHLQKSLN